MGRIYAQTVREAVKELAEFSFDELIDKLHPTTFEGLRDIKRALSRFCREGEVAALGSDRYSYVGKKKLTKLEKMWRAMRITGQFTRQDIVRLTGASGIHVKKYFIFLKRNGFIVPVSGRGYRGGIFKLADPDKAPLEHPRLKR
jgi:hypothetical protein